jgi:hypothetical protein
LASPAPRCRPPCSAYSRPGSLARIIHEGAR